MNAGIVANRYARAIYEYAADKGGEVVLYKEMQVLSGNFPKHPTLRFIMCNPIIDPDEKVKALVTASGIQISPVLKQVIEMIVRNGRANCMENIALMYEKVYKKAKGVVVAHLVTVDPAGEETKKTLIQVISKIMGNKTVEFNSEINPEIIGGFVLEIEDNRLDASVINQLNQLRLEIKN